MFPSPFARLFGMVSASFVTAKDTVNNRGKLPKSQTVIRKLSFALRPRCPIFVYGGAIFALPGTFSLVTAVRFSDGQEAFFIDYSGAKYARFPPKIAAALKALFRVVENGKFLKRLRNVHLEKSAVTGLFRA